MAFLVPATSNRSGRTYDIRFENDPTEDDIANILEEIARSESDTGQGLLSSVANAVPRGLVSGAGSTVEGLGDIASIAIGDNLLQAAGQDIKDYATESFPVNPVHEPKFITKAAGVVGQVGEVALEAATGVGLVGKLGAAKPVAMGGAFLKGSDAGEDAARLYSMPDAQRAAAILGGGLIEAGTEAFGGLGSTGFNPLRGGVRGFLKTAAVEGTEEVAAGVAEEALVRTLAAGEQGKAANGVPLPRPLDVGQRVEEFALGAIGGGVLGAPMLFDRSKTPPGAVPSAAATPAPTDEATTEATTPEPVTEPTRNYAQEVRARLAPAVEVASEVDLATAEVVKAIASVATAAPTQNIPKTTLSPGQSASEVAATPSAIEGYAIEDSIEDDAGQNNDVRIAKFYSALSQALQQKMPAMASPEQVKGIISGGGVKADEVKWSGILPWLESQGGKVSKQQVLDYLAREGAVRFEEVRLEALNADTLREAIKNGIRETRVDALDAKEFPSWESDAKEMIANGEKALRLLDEGDVEGAAELARINSSMEYGYGDDPAWQRARRIADGEDRKSPAYSNYQLPGGANYREVVVTMPVKSKRDPIRSFKRLENGSFDVVFVDGEEGNYTSLDDARADGAGTAEIRGVDEYRSSHFQGVQNYLAHYRANDRVDAEGRPGMFLEELQSDRHQAGRDKGYAGEKSVLPAASESDIELKFVPPTVPEGHDPDFYPGYWESYDKRTGQMISRHPIMPREMVLRDAVQLEYHDWDRRQSEADKAVPDAPYRTTWPLMLFKRALRDAVASGKQWIGWTSGATQAERYALSDKVDSIRYLANKDGTFDLKVYSLNSEEDADPMLDKSGLSAQELADYIGKELAKEAVNGKGDRFGYAGWKGWEGEGLNIGGEGMKGFYDTILPKEIWKYVKQWGAKVEKATLPEGESFWQVAITPEMAAEVSEEGQPLFDQIDPGDFESAMAGDDAAFARLDEQKERLYGAAPRGGANQARGQRFTSVDEFISAFNAAFDAKDFDAALEAVKASDRSLYAGYMRQLFREAAAGNETSKAKVEWFRAIFNGQRPPGVASPPPPQPPPQQAQATPPPPPATPPPVPPPVPPKPPDKSPFNPAAVLLLAKGIAASASISRLMRTARGAFNPQSRRVTLHAHIFKDAAQAAKTLAHEIGHAIDYAFRAVAGAQLAKKLTPISDPRVVFGHLWDWSGGKMSKISRLLKAEAIGLSMAWRGPFAADDKYRNSASELYADFLSAVLNDPDYAFQVAPNMTHAFFAALSDKPAVEAAYNMVNDLLRTDRLLTVLRGGAAKTGRDAVVRVIATAEDHAHGRRSWREKAWALYSALVNAHGKQAAKDGGYWASMKRRAANLGSDYVTKQEEAEQFAHRRSSVYLADMAHRVFKKIDAGIGWERFSTYLRNLRIQNEQTATGAWIKSEPGEARKMLQWLAEAAVMPEWVSEFNSVSDDGLYAAAAKFIWKLHEQGRFDAVKAAASRVNAPAFAQEAMFAFDVSPFMLNPQGITPETAMAQNGEIERELGPEDAARLGQYVSEFHKLNADVMREAYALGIISKTTWTARIEPNIDNYVPFMVLDYFTGAATAKMLKRHGTSRDILPAHLAGVLKSLAFIRRMQWQQMALNLREHYEVHGKGLFDNEMTIRDELTEAERALIERRGGGVVGFWENGRFKWMVLQDGAVVDAMQKMELGALTEPLFKLARMNSNFWRLLFTTYNIGFTIRNAMRTGRSLAEATGFRGLRHAQKMAKIARDYARASFGSEWTPEIRSLVERGVLPPPEKTIRADLTVDDLADQILRGAIAIDTMTRGIPGNSVERALHRNKAVRATFGRLADAMASASAFVESLPKIAAEQAYRDKGMSERDAAAMARLEGIPNPRVRAGKYGAALDQVLLFYRVAIQGLRRSRTLMLNPQTRGGYALRLGISYGLMKSFYVLAASGAVDALFGGGQKDWEQWIKRTTPYKLEQDDVMFLGWLDGKGNYHFPFGNAEIPIDWTPVSFRIPSGEEGRHLAPLTATAIASMTGSEIAPVDPAQRLIETARAMVPSANPTPGLLVDWVAIGRPVAPQDDYRGRPVVPDDEWKAGYASRIWGMIKHTAATANLDFARQDVVANKGLPQWMQVTKSTPVAGTAMNALFATDNYAGVREGQRERMESEQIAAQARLMRGRATVRAMRQLDALKTKADRTPAQEEQYQKLKDWHRQYYQGSKKAPGLFATLKAKAAGVDNVDADFAIRRLDETARAAME